MLDLETLQHSTFADLVGQRFHVVAGEGFELELSEAKLLGHRRADASRDPFSLAFRGAHGLRLPQGIYRFENETLGAMEIFIAQTGDSARGSEFEAVFT
jgi:hypothetical protein